MLWDGILALSRVRVIEEAWKVLNRAKKLKQIIDEERQVLTGTFEVGVLPTIAPYLIPRFFPQLMNEHPEMDVRITEMKTEDMRRALRRGDKAVYTTSPPVRRHVPRSWHVSTDWRRCRVHRFIVNSSSVM